MSSNKEKICFVVSTLITAKAFLDNHIKQLSNTFDIYIVANLLERDYEYLQALPLKGYKHIEIERKISPFKDSSAVLTLSHYFKEQHFFAVHSVTPKAGLITALAGKLANIEKRIHIFTGQVWASKVGIMRDLLKMFDKLIVRLDTHILVDGNSQREFLIEQKVLNETNSVVLSNGSIAGVDTERFKPNNAIRKDIRRKLGIKENQIVFVFIGRLCKDKGIDELLKSFTVLLQDNTNIYLLLVGSDEENYTEKIKKGYNTLKEKENFCLYGPTSAPEQLLNAGDVFCLPSYREGFGMSVVEAASTGLATIVSDAYGLRDSIIPEITGLVCKKGDVESLYSTMQYLIEHPDYIDLLGRNGRDFIQKKFNQMDVSAAWVDFYKSLR